ncbi:hypothetical protein H4W80_008812 [Nonomuraea angiospora]|uniref:Uncharacterized protein n=1 Tax=Nonomuraea angiospora TaxID=46172 RepID=A0ABR9MCB9_9ACTN|nr:hypothetical protein [Nonomuraea angiospora]MBE1590554.1 hypothetical protein [Nonomuraea angiospora]
MTGSPGACLAALVSASRAVRSRQTSAAGVIGRRAPVVRSSAGASWSLRCSVTSSLSASGSGGTSSRSAATAERASTSPSLASARALRTRATAPATSPRSVSMASATSSCTPRAPRECASTSWSSLAMRVRSSSAMALARSCWACRYWRRWSAKSTVSSTTVPRTTIADRGCSHQSRLPTMSARSVTVTATIAAMLGVMCAANSSNIANTNTVGAGSADPETDAATAEPAASAATATRGNRPSSRTNASQHAMDPPSADHSSGGTRSGSAATSDQARTRLNSSLTRRPVSGSSAARSRTTRPHTSRIA